MFTRVLADEVACSGPRLRNVGHVPRPNWDVHAAYGEHAPAACQQVLRPTLPQAATGTNEEPAVVAGNPDGDAVGTPCLALIGRDLDLALPGSGFDHSRLNSAIAAEEPPRRAFYSPLWLGQAQPGP